MKAKLNYSDVDDRKYVGVTLFVGGIFAVGVAVNIAFPALTHLASKLL